MTRALHQVAVIDADAIGLAASASLVLEIETYPKPGLVSPVDAGAHDDMDAAMMTRSAVALEPYFTGLAQAGAAGAEMDRLRAIGIAAEVAMMAATGGVNTHRGAIFGMGMLCAAAGFRAGYGVSGALGSIVMQRWGAEILRGPVALHSHGSVVARRHAAGGARVEAGAGFPTLYGVALPALAAARDLAPDDPEVQRVQTLMSLISRVEDTNLLYRGGVEGLSFAQTSARDFLDAGGVAAPDWREHGIGLHRAFTARRLSPGGCADLLAMALFVEACGA